MALMGTAEQDYVRDRLSDLPRAVRLVVFTRNEECDSCGATEELAHEIAGVVAAVRVDVVAENDAERGAAYGIDKRPAMAVEPAETVGPANGIRFFGFPGGYEFDSLLEAIARVSRADPGLSGELLAQLLEESEPLHLQVFVTQTCPYCPRMVQLAHRLALVSPLVRADMVDAAEFPHLAARYGVQGVPLTVIGETDGVVGSVPESRLLDAIRHHRHAAH